MSANSGPPPRDHQRLFEQFLRCIDREETLIHYRMSWGLQCNLALFAAVLALYALQQPKIFSDTLKEWATIGIAALGFLASVLSSIGIQAAHQQTNYLKAEIMRRVGIYGDSDSHWSGTEFIRPFGNWQVHKAARRVSGFLPLMFCGMWILIFIWALLAFEASIVPPRMEPEPRLINSRPRQKHRRLLSHPKLEHQRKRGARPVRADSHNETQLVYLGFRSLSVLHRINGRRPNYRR